MCPDSADYLADGILLFFVSGDCQIKKYKTAVSQSDYVGKTRWELSRSFRLEWRSYLAVVAE